MRRRDLIALLGLVLAAPGLARAQPRHPFRIGMVYVADAQSVKAYHEAFLAGLREEGFDPGRDVVIDARHADGQVARLPALVDEVVAARPDVMAGLEQVAQLMRARTTTIPIVLFSGADPVASGLVKSLARPGTNVTGMASATSPILKQLELLRAILPALRSVAILSDPATPYASRYREAVSAAAGRMRVELAWHSAGDHAGIQAVFQAMARNRPEALIVQAAGVFNNEQRFIAESALRQRIAAAGGVPSWADAGFLLSYNTDLFASFRRSASHAARILRGANPAELPVEQGTTFHLVVNLATARALGTTVPQSVRILANRVID
jgi:putative ABC transport system substrate-binding protein